MDWFGLTERDVPLPHLGLTHKKGLSKESAVRQDSELFNRTCNRYCQRKLAKGLQGKSTHSISKLDYYTDVVINGKCSPFSSPQPRSAEIENPERS